MLQIRPFFKHPIKAVRKGHIQKSGGATEPITQINEAAYNPALERRLNYRQVQCQFGDMVKTCTLNVNYLITDPVYETAFRSDVKRIETAGNMAIKPPPEGEMTQNHEFIPVTTSFKDTIKNMLTMKFQSFFTYKMSGKRDPLEKQRDEKLYESEKTRKAQAVLTDSLVAKSLNENFDEKNYLKLMKGPFFNYISKDGIQEDDLVNSATNDLIDSANQEVMKVLVIGKPRSGKTTLAKELEKRLDLVRIAPDIWLQDLFKRILEKEEKRANGDITEDEEEEQAEGQEEEAAAGEESAKEEENKEEGQEEGKEGEGEAAAEGEEEVKKEPEPPKRDKKDMWLTELEYEVMNKFRAGGSLTLDQIDEILKLMVQSPVA